MNFKTKATANTTVKFSPTIIPNVVISEQAINEMFVYTKEVSDEVGWLGTVHKLEDGTYYIEKTFLFDQEVHGTTTEITPEGLSSFGEALLQQEDGVEIWNNLKMWGHSHVNMATNPSGQDDKQMNEFSNVGHDFFIRLITNKSGSLRLDLYDYEGGLTFLDLPYGIEESVDPQYQQIDAELGNLKAYMEQLENQLQMLKEKNVTEITPVIQAEIKEKVRKKYATVGYGRGYGGYQGTQNVNQGDGKGETTYYQQRWDDPFTIDVVELLDIFSEREIKHMAQTVTNQKDFKSELARIGYLELLTNQDIQSLYSKLVQVKWGIK